ncbi:Soluble lytic murein transglycosylase [gamma proteobacterium HdN1]|nr:Soluble lytic murein transglycosylase [gamma proteobacterium HdN1]
MILYRSVLLAIALASACVSLCYTDDSWATHPTKSSSKSVASKASHTKAAPKRAVKPVARKSTKTPPRRATPAASKRKPAPARKAHLGKKAAIVGAAAGAATITAARPMDPTLASLASTAIHQREQYRQALAALRDNRIEDFQRITARLQDYPLYPYLELQEFALHLGPVSFAEVKQFATRYQSSPAGSRMSHAWLRAQAAEGDWPTLLNHYHPGQFGEEFDCLYYRAKYETGASKEAFRGAEKLWNVGYSQSNACDPLFEAWKSYRPIPDKLVLERIGKALHNHKPQLAEVLQRSVSQSRQPLAREWIKVYEEPQQIAQVNYYLAQGNAIAPIVVTGLERLARNDPDQAGQLWLQYRNRLPFSRTQQQRILLQISRFKQVNFAEDTEYWLNAALAVGAPDVVPIGIRNALRAQDWERAGRWLSAVNDDERSQFVWQYWRARTDQWLATYYARQKLARPTALPRTPPYSYMGIHRRFMAALADPYRLRETFPARVKAMIAEAPPPATTFELLAQERNYYGFLASHRIGTPLKLNQRQYSLDGKMRNVVRNSAALNRVLEFQALGQEADARRELMHAVKYMSEDEKIAAALIARQAGWYLHAILLAQHSSAQDDLNIRFPVLLTDLVLRRSSDAGITPEWTYAIIRQESAFWQDALSPVGARGYMQLMPATAREVAKSIGLRIATPSDINRPETNIQLGTTYLGKLQRQLDGNTILATAAYNAGAGRARRWQPKDTPMPGDIWVETIPFTETRDYVKNVVAYQAIYKHKLGKPTVLIHDMEWIPPLQSATPYQGAMLIQN